MRAGAEGYVAPERAEKSIESDLAQPEAGLGLVYH